MEAVRTLHTIEEYIELEKQSDIKHEYIDGHVYAMAGGTPAHSLISNNIGSELRRVLRGKSCRAYSADLQIAVSDTKYVYADVSVICGPVSTGERHPNAATNPVLIVEVLSPSTEEFDKAQKFRFYRAIPSFREYVQVSQTERLVEVFYKVDDDLWRIRSYYLPDHVVRLESVNADIPLTEIYADLDLPIADSLL